MRWKGKVHGCRLFYLPGIGEYLGTLVPVIGFVKVGGQAKPDRYTYIPLIGIFICMVWGANRFLAGMRPGRVSLATVGILVAAACVVATPNQVKYWRNNLLSLNMRWRSPRTMR